MIDPPARDYRALTLDLPHNPTRTDRMRAVVDAIWQDFQTRRHADRGVSWVGFYLAPGESFDGVTAGADEMILAVRQPKPACSPIALHGACGKSFLTHKPLVVTDVALLGENYVACDPRDKSELVVPCLDDAGDCFAVLDLDSFDVGAFSVADAEALIALLGRAGLTAPRREANRPVVY